MSQRTTWVDAIETLPVKGATIKFDSRSGDETLHFAMDLSVAVAVAYDILAAAAEAAARPPCEVIPILGHRPLEYSAHG